MGTRRSMVTGITGQDGSYLAELLLDKGYEVIGMVRRSSTITFERVEHLQDEIEIIQGDLHDQSSLVGIVEEYAPDVVCVDRMFMVALKVPVEAPDDFRLVGEKRRSRRDVQRHQQRQQHCGGARPGHAQRQHRHQRAARRGVVTRLRRRHAPGYSCPEFSFRPGDGFLGHIG